MLFMAAMSVFFSATLGSNKMFSNVRAPFESDSRYSVQYNLSIDLGNYENVAKNKITFRKPKHGPPPHLRKVSLKFYNWNIFFNENDNFGACIKLTDL